MYFSALLTDTRSLPIIISFLLLCFYERDEVIYLWLLFAYKKQERSRRPFRLQFLRIYRLHCLGKGHGYNASDFTGIYMHPCALGFQAGLAFFVILFSSCIQIPEYNQRAKNRSFPEGWINAILCVKDSIKTRVNQCVSFYNVTIYVFYAQKAITHS